MEHFGIYIYKKKETTVQNHIATTPSIPTDQKASTNVIRRARSLCHPQYRFKTPSQLLKSLLKSFSPSKFVQILIPSFCSKHTNMYKV